MYSPKFLSSSFVKSFSNSEDGNDDDDNDINDVEDENDGASYYSHLENANEEDFKELERTKCVSLAKDRNGDNILIFIPKIGINSKSQSDIKTNSKEIFRQILLCFIKLADTIVKEKYSIIYGHTNLSLLNQQPLVYKYYKMLPRKYKKNLVSMHILHAQIGIKTFFEVSRVFISHKFYNKLQYHNSIIDLQDILSIEDLQLPAPLHLLDDQMRGFAATGFLIPLKESFDENLGTTHLLSCCVDYLRSNGGLDKKGIFRIPGDNNMILLSKIRLQRNKVSSAYSLPSYYVNTDNPAISLQSHVLRLHNILIGKSINEFKSSTSSSTSLPSNSAKMSDIMIDDIDTIAQLIKLSIRELPDSLITNIAYIKLKRSLELFPELLSAPKKELEKKSFYEWGNMALGIINTMPIENKSTLLHILNFLIEICNNTVVNSMDASNLAVIFAPTLINIDETDPISAMKEIKFSQTIIKGLILKLYNDRYINDNTIHKNIQLNEDGNLISFDNVNDLISFDYYPPKPPITTSIDTYFCQDSDDDEEDINSFQPTISIEQNAKLFDNEDLIKQFSLSLGMSDNKLAEFSKIGGNMRQSTRINDRAPSKNSLLNLKDEKIELENNIKQEKNIIW